MDAQRPLAQFQRAAHVIRERISQGTYPVGSQLPSIAVLAAELGSSHMTIKQALATLSSEGVIATRRGVPAEVLAAPSPKQQLSIAERLARVEVVVTSLDERVTAMEDHVSNYRESQRPQP